jgi:hypothetical protein
LIKVSKVKVVMNEFDDCWVWLVVICGDDEWKWKWRWWWRILQNLYILLLIFILCFCSPSFSDFLALIYRVYWWMLMLIG